MSKLEFIRNEKLLFDTDWNWLMVVVEKIEYIRCYVTIKGCAVNISTIVETSAPTKIESVYKACVEFINWYKLNENDK